jgi:acyl-CoA thioester hydrolase
LVHARKLGKISDGVLGAPSLASNKARKSANPNSDNYRNLLIFAAMSRTKLTIPKHLPFACRLPIRITDLNYGRHLGNDKVLTLMHEARVQYFKSFGYEEDAAEGTSFIMGDCVILYKAEGSYGQVLRCELGAGDFTRVSFDIFYRFIIEGEEKLLVEAKTGMVCFDYSVRKVRAVPDVLRRRLEADAPQAVSEQASQSQIPSN